LPVEGLLLPVVEGDAAAPGADVVETETARGAVEAGVAEAEEALPRAATASYRDQQVPVLAEDQCIGILAYDAVGIGFARFI
jgi:hypothetical protein